MNCLDPENLQVQQYLDGLLSASERTRLEEHLTHCSECRSELQSTRILNQLTRSFPQVEPPPIRLPQNPSSWKGWGALLAAALLLFLVWPRSQAPQSTDLPAPQLALQTPQPIPIERPQQQTLAVQEKAWTTGDEARVIALAGQVLTLGPHTRLEFESQQDNRMRLKLHQGDVRVQEHGQTISVATAHLVAEPVGTDFQVWTNGKTSRVHVFSGKVRVARQILSAGQSYPITAVARPAAPPPSIQPAPTPQLPHGSYPVRQPETPQPEPTFTPIPEWHPGWQSREPGWEQRNPEWRQRLGPRPPLPLHRTHQQPFERIEHRPGRPRQRFRIKP